MDKELRKIVEGIFQNVEVRHIKVNGRDLAQIEFFLPDGSHHGCFFDGQDYTPGEDIIKDLGALYVYMTHDSPQIVKRRIGAAERGK